MKTLFESYKDYFRVGAAVSGILLMNDDEKAKLYENISETDGFKDEEPDVFLYEKVYAKLHEEIYE